MSALRLFGPLHSTNPRRYHKNNNGANQEESDPKILEDVPSLVEVGGVAQVYTKLPGHELEGYGQLG